MASAEDVARILRAQPGIRASDLLAALRLSQSRVSRLTSELGDRVVRFGKARATRYALARSVADVGTSAPIHEVDEHGEPRAVGRLHFVEVDGYALTYADEQRFHQRLPVFLRECGPSGFLGRHFARSFPELGFPERLDRWLGDDYARAIALRGEDAVGNLVVGDESLRRFLRYEEQPREVAEYPELVREIAVKTRHSSAGGERPQFTAFVDGRHVLVKFAGPGDGEEARRWRDLLLLEHFALEVIREAGFAPAVESRCIDLEGLRFFEVVRFDRVNRRGRVGVRSLDAVRSDADVVGGSWTEIVDRLTRGVRPHVSAADAVAVRWLDAFGGLTANNDRHDGNVSFFCDAKGTLSLAPAYDTAPMALAPVATGVLQDAWQPALPEPSAVEEWKAAVPWALVYWERVEGEATVDLTVRRRASEARAAVESLAESRFPGLRPKPGVVMNTATTARHRRQDDDGE
jgi:hypothetical protein